MGIRNFISFCLFIYALHPSIHLHRCERQLQLFGLGSLVFISKPTKKRESDQIFGASASIFAEIGAEKSQSVLFHPDNRDEIRGYFGDSATGS